MKNKTWFLAFCLFSVSIAFADTIPQNLLEGNFSEEFDLSEMPANDIYNSWNIQWLNPYKIKIDSLPDSVNIACTDFVYPLVSNRITSPFGLRGCRYHYGIDLGLAVGDTVRATFGGKVRIRDYERRGYGHYVAIRHDNGLETVYAHLSEVLVEINQDVKAGEPIGLGGNTGRSTGPHLHYEIRFLGNAFNPTKLIDFKEKKCKYDDEYIITLNETYSHKEELAELSKAAYHRVRRNDNLSRIAQRYGTTVRKLCKLNKISPRSILRIGQQVRYR